MLGGQAYLSEVDLIPIAFAMGWKWAAVPHVQGRGQEVNPLAPKHGVLPAAMPLAPSSMG